MNAIEQHSLADQLMQRAFPAGRQARSPEYREGVRAAIESRAGGGRLRCPYHEGTAQADAFFAGADEGKGLWREHLAAEERRLGLTDRAALEIAHSRLCTKTPLNDMLENPTLRVVLGRVAQLHAQRRTAFDPKKAQANDND